MARCLRRTTARTCPPTARARTQAAGPLLGALSCQPPASQACSLSKQRAPVSGPPRRAGTSDLVGQMVGALVSTALVFEDADAPYYERLMSQALALYGAGMHRRGKYSDVFLYDCAPQARTLL